MRTPVYAYHRSHSRKMVDFSGWDMPLYFNSLVEEYGAVRAAVGLFDVSHMGKLIVNSGSEAVSFLAASSLPEDVNVCKYTHLLDTNGRIVDDVIFTCVAPGRYLCVSNAGATGRVARLMIEHLGGEKVVDLTVHLVCLAIQGPQSTAALQSVLLTPIKDLKPFRGVFARVDANAVRGPVEMEGWEPGPHPLGLENTATDVYITRTGYTGEVGFEIFATNKTGFAIWLSLLGEDRAHRVVAAGLGARDILRLEMGYLLSGQDFDGHQTPLEASYAWLVDWDHDFVGKEPLERLREQGGYPRLTGVRLLDRAIPRRGNTVYRSGSIVGKLTSASFSPGLRVGIGLGYLEADVRNRGEEVEVEIRGKRHPAVTVKPPFLQVRS